MWEMLKGVKLPPNYKVPEGVASTLPMWEMLKGGRSWLYRTGDDGVASTLSISISKDKWEILRLLEKLKGAED